MKTTFHDIDDFPQLRTLCGQWETIRDEFLRLRAPVMAMNRHGKRHEEVLRDLEGYLAAGHAFGWMEGWGPGGGNPDWLQYALMVFGAPVPCVDPVLARTMAMLGSLGGLIKVAAFAQLNAGAMLPVHTHPEIGEEQLLQLHLPLVTATHRNYAYLNVAGEFRQFVSGQPLIFDGSLDHFVLNESPTDRVILYMEFSRRLRMG